MSVRQKHKHKWSIYIYINFFTTQHMVWSLSIAECGQPNADESTTVQVTSTSHGSEATYTCTSGFDTIEGETVRLCGSDGQWSGKAPVCKLIGNHTYKESGYQFKSMSQYL